MLQQADAVQSLQLKTHKEDAQRSAMEFGIVQ